MRCKVAAEVILGCRRILNSPFARCQKRLYCFVKRPKSPVGFQPIGRMIDAFRDHGLAHLLLANSPFFRGFLLRGRL